MSLAAYTVWEFRSVDGKQVVVTVRCSEPDDFSHDFQKVLWRGNAFSKADALHRYWRTKW